MKTIVTTSPQTLLAFVGLAFFIVGCASKGKDSTEKELSTSKKQTQTATQVHTAEAVRKPFAGVGKVKTL